MCICSVSVSLLARIEREWSVVLKGWTHKSAKTVSVRMRFPGGAQRAVAEGAAVRSLGKTPGTRGFMHKFPQKLNGSNIERSLQS